MTTLILPPKFQVVIPKHIREALQPTAPMPMQVVQYGDRIEFIPVQPIKGDRVFKHSFSVPSAPGRRSITH